jgi:hypothetical protein
MAHHDGPADTRMMGIVPAALKLGPAYRRQAAARWTADRWARVG